MSNSGVCSEEKTLGPSFTRRGPRARHTARRRCAAKRCARRDLVTEVEQRDCISHQSPSCLADGGDGVSGVDAIRRWQAPEVSVADGGVDVFEVRPERHARRRQLLENARTSGSTRSAVRETSTAERDARGRRCSRWALQHHLHELLAADSMPKYVIRALISVIRLGDAERDAVEDVRAFASSHACRSGSGLFVGGRRNTRSCSGARRSSRARRTRRAGRRSGLHVDRAAARQTVAEERGVERARFQAARRERRRGD